MENFEAEWTEARTELAQIITRLSVLQEGVDTLHAALDSVAPISIRPPVPLPGEDPHKDQVDHNSTRFRDDGFSHEASEFGAFEHEVLNRTLDRLARGDKYDRAVAERADQFLAFDYKIHPEMDPGDDARRLLVRKAAVHTWGPWLIFAPKTYHAGFKIKKTQEEMKSDDFNRNTFFHWIDGHGFVHLDKSRDPAAYARSYAASLLLEAKESRRVQIEVDSGIIRPG